MKRFFTVLLVCLIFTLGICAAGTYEYIIPVEAERIEFGSYYGTGRYIRVLDKSGKESIYTFSGKKIIGGYDYVSIGENGIGVGKRGDEYDIINYQGRVLGTFGSEFIALSGPYVLTDLGGNTDDRPIFYYGGEFAVCDYQGNQLKTLPYAKHVPERNAGYGLSFDGGMMVLIENGKYGAINQSFEVAIKPEYDMIYSFARNRYSTIAVKDGKHGIIDYDGNVLTPFEYDYIESVSEYGEHKYYKVQKGEKWGIIGPDGKTALMPLCNYYPEQVYTDYSLVKVSKANTRSDSSEYPLLYGLVDYYGNVVLQIEHISIGQISEGIIPADKAYDRGGYYNLLGKEISSFKYRLHSPYSEGYAFASSCIGGIWTHEVLNINGKVVFTTSNWSKGFNNGIAHIGNGKFIDTTGKVVFTLPEKVATIHTAFGSVENEGLIPVTNGKYYGVVKYTPEKAEPAWEFEYIDFYGKVNTITKCPGGYQFAMKDGTYRYFDLKGNRTYNEAKVLGYNIFYVGDYIEIRNNDNQVVKMLKASDCEYVIEGKQEVAIVYDNSVMIIPKSPGCERDVYDWSLEASAGLAEFYMNEAGQYYCKENDGRYYIIGSRTPYDAVLFLGSRFAAKRSGGWFVVDKDGTEINKTPLASQPIMYEGCDKCYVVQDSSGTKIYNKNLDLVSNLGNIAIQSMPTDEWIIIFGKNSSENGVINVKGDVIIPVSNCTIEYLGKGLFKVYRSGSYSIVTSYGRVLISGCRSVTALGDNGYIGVSTSTFEGYIDESGIARITLPRGYYVQGPFNGGMAPVVQNIIYGNYGQTSYIDENGRIVLAAKDYEWCSGGEFKNSIALVYTNLGKAGPLGVKLIKCVYNNPSDWAWETVIEALDKGIVKKDTDRRYRKNISREDFCEIVYELPVVQAALRNAPSSTIKFTDTDNEMVKALTSLGIIYGVGNGKFDPHSYVTREQIATILDRIYQLGHKAPTPDGFKYADDASISDWAKASVYNMRAAGIMIGMGQDIFSPDTMCTTEQTIVAAMRLY